MSYSIKNYNRYVKIIKDKYNMDINFYGSDMIKYYIAKTIDFHNILENDDICFIRFLDKLSRIKITKVSVVITLNSDYSIFAIMSSLYKIFDTISSIDEDILNEYIGNKRIMIRTESI